MICTAHSQEVTVTRTDDPELLTVTLEATRTLRNVTRTTVAWPVTFALDESGPRRHPTVIDRLGCAAGTQRWTKFELESRSATHVAARLPEPLRLAPGEECTVWFSGTETHLLNGDLRLALLTATVDPVVSVNVPPGFERGVEFGGREQDTRELDPGTFEYKGTLLPLQATRVRWWPSNQAEIET